LELLQPAYLTIFATALAVCAALSLAMTLIARYFGLSRETFALLFLTILALALLGFVTGLIMGESREPAVRAVLPGVLTFLGGVFIYLIGAKGIQTQAVVSCAVFCFVVTLLIGTQYGALLRTTFDSANSDPTYLRARDLALEQYRFSLEAARLRNYVELLKLKNAYAEKEKLDLSRFESTFEAKQPDKTKPPEK
jgi:hypothetical protein